MIRTGYDIWLLDRNGVIIDGPDSSVILKPFPIKSIFEKAKNQEKSKEIIEKDNEKYSIILTPLHLKNS